MFGQRQVSLAVSMLAWLQMFWLLKPCLWELTCLTSDAALETYLVWIFAVPEEPQGLVPG